MELNFNEKELAFQQEVREFLKNKLPKEIADKGRRAIHLAREDFVTWNNILNEKGWLAYNWPKEYGGAEWTAVQRHIFEEECARAHAPRIIPFGLNMLAPVLMKYGSKEQCEHYLPRMLDSTDWWCQGYSEPGSGSDLASLKTKAENKGDHYLVNGQKTWTTLAQYADWIFCLVRTSNEGKAQEGISFILIDMKTPGVTVRPIITLDGWHEVNEVFFDNVKVPIENLVGEENMGWTYAKYLLTHERTGTASVGDTIEAMRRLKYMAQNQMKNGKPLIEDPLFAARLAQIEIELSAMQTTNLRTLFKAVNGGAPALNASMLKVKGTEVRQALDDLSRRCLGPDATPYIAEALEAGYNEPAIGPDYAMSVASEYFNHRKITIYAGSNEVQKNIITKLTMSN